MVGGQTALPAQGLAGRPYLLFRSTNLDRNFGRLGLVPSDDPSGARALSAMSCDRVDFEGGRGFCVSQPKVSVLSSTNGVIFDSHFHPLKTVHLAGFPSRVKVSPDGRFAAATNFVSGDSYATMGFSTRTDLIDMHTGAILYDLEKLSVKRDGKAFFGSDFNFWGVTFSNDGRMFYATLGTGGQTYLIHGDVATRQATVLTSGVECPSLSPDGKRIAFKKRLPGVVVTWRLSVLDLDTLAQHPLADTRNVDDQVTWLNNQTVMYGLPQSPSEVASLSASTPGPPVLASGASIATDTWTVPADGSGTPTQFMVGSWSTVLTNS